MTLSAAANHSTLHSEHRHMPNCIHGLDPRFCALCNRRPSNAVTLPGRPAASTRQRRRFTGDAPSTSQWKAFVATVDALKLKAPRDGQLHVCILCGLAMQWLDAVEPQTRWSGLTGGTRTDPGSRRIISHLGPATIRIGARIKVWEHVDVGDDEPELQAKIVPMTMTGLGCSVCRELMFRETIAALGDYYDENAQFDRNMASPGMARAIRKLGRTPQRRVPYIDVTDRVSEMPSRPPTEARIDPATQPSLPEAAKGRTAAARTSYTKPGMTALERWRALHRREQQA